MKSKVRSIIVRSIIVRSIIVRSITMVAGTLALMASVAVAQCGPKSDASPKAGMSGHGKSKTLVGVVTDSTCGRTHSMMPGKSDAECTRACITKGSKYALIVGDKVYTLEGQADALDKLAVFSNPQMSLREVGRRGRGVVSFRDRFLPA